MYKQTKPKSTSLKINASYQGETIEAKVRRIVNNKQPITDGAPEIYTDRKKGVIKAMDIRTDKWEVAVEGQEKVAQIYHIERKERIKKRPDEIKKAEEAAAAAAAAQKNEGGA